MKLKTFKIKYKNGNILTTKAYSMELKDGKLYQCCKALVGDQGIPSVIDGSFISKVEEVCENVRN